MSNVFDVLREKLKERKKSEIDLSNKYMDIDRRTSTAYANKALAIGEVIEIVNQVEQEYNDGWIPYESENMPNQEVLVDCTIVRLSDNHRWVQNLIYCPYERHKWKWTDYPNDIYVDDKKFKVLAWKPVSEPYREVEQA